MAVARKLTQSSERQGRKTLLSIVRNVLLCVVVVLSDEITAGDEMRKGRSVPPCENHDSCRKTGIDGDNLHNRIFKVPSWADGTERDSDVFLANHLWNTLDAVLYVNLEHRKDRRESIETELRKIGVPAEKIRRIEGIRIEDAGNVGCAMSMARALDVAWNEGWNQVLILQDDFHFAHPKAIVTRLLSAFFRSGPSKWDGVLLAYGTGSAEETKWDFLLRTTGAKTMSGFLAHRRVYLRLRDQCLEAARLLREHKGEEGNYARHAADVMWNVLMQDGDWYLYIPKLGYQTPGYSDIAGRHMEYCMGADADGSHCIRV